MELKIDIDDQFNFSIMEIFITTLYNRFDQIKETLTYNEEKYYILKLSKLTEYQSYLVLGKKHLYEKYNSTETLSRLAEFTEVPKILENLLSELDYTSVEIENNQKLSLEENLLLRNLFKFSKIPLKLKRVP